MTTLPISSWRQTEHWLNSLIYLQKIEDDDQVLIQKHHDNCTKGLFTSIIKFVFIASIRITQFYHPMAFSLQASHLEYIYIRTQSPSFDIPEVYCYATSRLRKISTFGKQQVFSLGNLTLVELTWRRQWLRWQQYLSGCSPHIILQMTTQPS